MASATPDFPKPRTWLPYPAWRVMRNVSDIIFPPGCLNCGGLVARGDAADALRYVCAKCETRIEFVREPCCPTCGFPFYGELEEADNRPCEHCEGLVPVFTEGRTAVLFKGAARMLVHELKYNNAIHAIRDIGTLLEKSPRVLEVARGAVLVPVPLHSRKERHRGYNQAFLIAQCLAKAAGGAQTNTRVEMLLRRVVDTVSQTALDRATRRANLENAFALARDAKINPAQRYVLVDDVFTTGSTLNSCAGVLRRAKCADIKILTFAHG
jgi:ComF family protein